LSGLAFALLPGLVQTYLPTRWWEVPTLLFGLGAISVARHPEGVVLHFGRQVRSLPARLGALRHRADVSPIGAERSEAGNGTVVAAGVTTDSGPKRAAVR
jgi:branched-chain amino acid transport system permease protein